MAESKFQAKLIKELRNRFRGCIILKNDPNYLQGVPDLLLLWGNKWAALECKDSQGAVRGRNQVHYVLKMDRMSFAAFIYPENKETVLNDLQRAFKSRWPARIPRTK